MAIIVLNSGVMVLRKSKDLQICVRKSECERSCAQINSE